jgi:hypothetical protein
MKREITRAPPPSKLRPVKTPLDGAADASFPVYKNLADTLARAEDDDTIRHVCAVLAGWAYSDVDTVSAIMARMGLENNACRSIAVENNAMLISSSSFLVQSSCGRVVLLAYRGTDPFDLATWAADADVNPVLVPAQEHATLRGSIHGGFYRNQRATWFDVIEGLRGAARPEGGSIFDGLRQADPPLTGGHAHLDNPTQSKLEAIYITGHSLGAAMATIAAYKLATEDEYKGILEPGRLKGVHCFAPPMVGNEDFARQWEEEPRLRGKLSTYIFENDLVPHLPPVSGFVGASAGYGPRRRGVPSRGRAYDRQFARSYRSRLSRSSGCTRAQRPPIFALRSRPDQLHRLQPAGRNRAHRVRKRLLRP